MRYRTIFLSDVHLGTRGCSAAALLEFLGANSAETIYLVGDILDGWRMAAGLYWPPAHDRVVQTLLRTARHTRVVYVPGNHDELLRRYVGHVFGGIELVAEAEHVTADGRRLLITHGDAFDGITTYAKWMAVLGDHGYVWMMVANRWFNRVRRRLGFSYWSFSAFVKRSVKRAVKFISNYETAVADECMRRGFDGIVCGHIHHAELRPIGPILYANTGDWVESLTALVEHADGRLELLQLPARL